MATASSRTARLKLHRKKARSRLLTAVSCLLALLFALLVGVLAHGPRVALGSSVMGVDIGGMAASRAALSLSQAFRAQGDVTLRFMNMQLEVERSQLGFHPDFDAMARSRAKFVWWNAEEQPHAIAGEFDEGAFSSIVSRIQAMLPEPKNARIAVDQDKVFVVDSQDGFVVEQHVFLQCILGLMATAGSAIDVPLARVSAEFTTEMAESLGLKRLLGRYATAYTEDLSRSENIKVATLRLTGIMLAPGEELSFNERVGPRHEELGYKQANVFIGDRIETGYGGGVCQVSTTLYNAALLANLEIVERHSHSMTVDYVPLGRDAAVSYGEVDLVIRNSTENYVLIMAEAVNGEVSFSVFGDAPRHTVEIETRVISKTDFETETIYDSSLLEDAVLVIPGKTGYRVATYRLVGTEDGDAIRSFLGYSNYRPMKQVVREAVPTSLPE